MQADVASTRGGFVPAVDEIDLRALGSALWRKRAMIIGLALTAAVIAFVVVNSITPRYRSEARVLIEARDNIFTRPDAEKLFDRGTIDQEAVTSQVQLILSRDLARDTIRNLKLGERAEFDPVLRGRSFLSALFGILGIAKDPMSQTPEERVLKSYFDRLSVFQVEKSRVIAIEFDSEDPELAAKATNAIAEGYLVLQQAARQEQTRAASIWLSREIDMLRAKVADAEAKVEQHRANSNLLVGTNNTTLSNQQLGDLNAQLAAARAQRADIEAKARIIRDTLRTGAQGEFTDISNSELLRRLTEQRVTLRAQLAEQSSTLLDQHPRIKELRAQIADLERQIRSEGDRLMRTLENDAKLSGARVEALTASLDQLKNQAASTNGQDVQLRAFERDAKSQRDLLESYLAKYREASSRDNIGAASADARIISAAIVSNTPAWPKKLPTVLLSALAMFMLCCGFVLTGELLNSAAVRPVAMVDDMPALVVAPPAAVARTATMPRMAMPKSGPLSAPQQDSLAEDVEAPLAALAAVSADMPVSLEAIVELAHTLAASGEAGRRIAVMGTDRNVGTTLSAIALARLLAGQGRVVLVDLALASPNLSVIAADPKAPGVAELAQGTASFGQVITRDRFSGIHLVTAGQLTGDAHEALSSPRLSIALEALARCYEFVVVDAGALPDLPAERIARLAPRAVLVAEHRESPATADARLTLLAAGFGESSVLTPVEAPAASPKTQAAA